MRYACIRDQGGSYPLTLLCRLLRVSRSGYYAWCQRGPSRRAQQDTQLRIAIRVLHAESRQRYGSPRIHRALQAAQWSCSRKRVVRLMQEERLRGKRARGYRRTTRADGTPPAPNYLQRQFQVPGPNHVWASDVTACETAAGWLYLAVVLDLASRRVIGWAAGPTMGQELTLPALRQALQRRQPPRGLLHHSDRGAHYTGSSYQQLLRMHGGIASMSRAGNCWDNAVVESFFATLKTELVREARWPSRRDGVQALRQYIRWYNRQRLHSTLNYQSPIAFETQSGVAA